MMQLQYADPALARNAPSNADPRPINPNLVQLNVVEYLNTLKTRCYASPDNSPMQQLTLEQVLKEAKILCKILSHPCPSENIKIQSISINLLAYILGNIHKKTSDALKKYFSPTSTTKTGTTHGLLVNTVLNIDAEEMLQNNPKLLTSICFLLNYINSIPGVSAIPLFRKQVFRLLAMQADDCVSEKIIAILIKIVLGIKPTEQEINVYRVQNTVLRILRNMENGYTVGGTQLPQLLFRTLALTVKSFVELFEKAKAAYPDGDLGGSEGGTDDHRKIHEQRQNFINHFFGAVLEVSHFEKVAFTFTDLRTLVDIGRDSAYPMRSYAYFSFLLQVLESISQQQFALMVQRGLFEILQYRWKQVKQAMAETQYFKIIGEVRRLAGDTGVVFKEAVEDKLECMELKEKFVESVRNCRTKEMFFSLKGIYCSYFRARIGGGQYF